MVAARLEAFSDAVIAVIITIMVLEMKAPIGDEPSVLLPLLPVFLTYVLSFVYLGIYWNNHHHLLKGVKQVTGRVMWSNLVLLFWLSLVPFFTAWLGENHGSAWPTALYGVDLLLCALSYTALQWAIVCQHGRGSKLAESIGRDWKGLFSIAAYVAAIGFAPFFQAVSDVLFVVVAVVWFIPDRRMKVVVHE
jgi:uncharacterized membrane protein